MIYTHLANRSVVQVYGENSSSLLQSLLTCDLKKISRNKTLYGCLLTPNGRFLHDFVVWLFDDSFFLTIEKDRCLDFIQRLSLYILKSGVKILERKDILLYAVWEDNDSKNYKGLVQEFSYGYQSIDPRIKELGSLIMMKNLKSFEEETSGKSSEVQFNEYDQHRLRHGIPDGSRDIKVGQSIPLGFGMVELGAISSDKGCYIGQELIAHLSRRSLIRKRLFPVQANGSCPPYGSSIFSGEKKVGEMLSSCNKYGLAHLSKDWIKLGESLSCLDIVLIPHQLCW